MRLLIAALLAGLFSAATTNTVLGADDWSEAVEVVNGTERCVSYRAALRGEYLIVEASHAPTWHTYAMDNPIRAAEKLAGKTSLGIEQPTRIELGEGLKAVGAWYQSDPEDLSRPELRWYTWGFGKIAYFAVKVDRTGPSKSMLTIRGQACNANSCRNVDLQLPVEFGDPGVSARPFDLKSLVKVRIQRGRSER